MTVALLPPAPEIIGRDSDVERVCAAFDAGARIVTLWGPGGIARPPLAELVERTRVALDDLFEHY